MTTLPKISSYGDYSSSNYGAHCLKIRFDNLTLWYSYETVIAFSTPKTGIMVSENCWNVTTGKHLNWIDAGDKKNRLSRSDFENELTKVLKELGLSE